MIDYLEPKNIYFLLAVIVPGLVITYTRSQFITGRLQKHSEALLSYVALSAIYGALAVPFADFLLPLSGTGSVSPFWWFALIFLAPAVIGVLLGISSRTEIFRKVIHKLGINPVHVMPTAWDWKFGAMKDQLVIVTLKDDTKFAGYCGRNSFMSSDAGERDIYIEKIYAWGENNSWNDAGEHGLLVSAGEIRTIEFFPVSEKEKPNDKQR